MDGLTPYGVDIRKVRRRRRFKMHSAELISVLHQYKVSHQAKYGIKRLGLFGSAARGTTTGQSDIDIVVELEKQNLFFMIGIKQDL